MQAEYSSQSPLNHPRYALFVYGTLRRSGSNHSLLRNATYCGETWISGYMMWSFGSYPAVVPSDNTEAELHRIKAELYDIDAAQLARIDRLEDYYGPDNPRNVYVRKQVKDDAGRSAFLYIFVPDRLQQKAFRRRKRLLPHGDWLA